MMQELQIPNGYLRRWKMHLNALDSPFKQVLQTERMKRCGS